jgi:hyperosmotically inducible periplasmic protein
MGYVRIQRQRRKLMREPINAVVAILVALTLSGCAAMTGKTAGENVDDATVTAAVKSQLVMDKAANLTRVDVDTDHGTVRLNGRVESSEQRARAEELAHRVKGVRRVINDLQIARR